MKKGITTAEVPAARILALIEQIANDYLYEGKDVSAEMEIFTLRYFTGIDVFIKDSDPEQIIFTDGNGSTILAYPGAFSSNLKRKLSIIKRTMKSHIRSIKYGFNKNRKF